VFGFFDYNVLNQIATDRADFYKDADPFPHTIIDVVADSHKLNDVVNNFPTGGWWNYDNHFEKKEAQDKIERLQKPVRELLCELNSGPFITFLEQLSGVGGLLPDPLFRGAGCHQIRRGGKLSIHADFNWHPKLKVYRRVNVLLYLNKDWDRSWGGNLELWKRDMSQPVWEIEPFFNRMVIFNSDDTSFHGHPEPLMCPDHITRKSLAIYYYTSEPPPDFEAPHSVKYQVRPGEILTPEQEALRKAREKFRDRQ
jgi:Rps23 Pro-64 3,4-dihydroxylase Tpa1-like proline 4-hydroxylase